MGDREFIAKYGAEPDDIRRMRQFAQKNGLSIEEINRARRSVILSGSAKNLEFAFGVQLYHYSYPATTSKSVTPSGTEKHYRTFVGPVHVPKYLAGRVLGVFGLDNRRLSRPNVNSYPGNLANLTVPAVAKFYNFPDYSATGQTIAIFSTGGYKLTDIQSYYQGLNGYTVPQIIDVPVNPTTDSNLAFAELETTQDICIASTVAQGAKIAVYFTQDTQKGWVDLIGKVVHPDPKTNDPVCSVLSCSYVHLQQDDSDGAFVATINAAFLDAKARSVTICVTSGDAGTDCGISDHNPHVEYPASDPWVLSCGGTTISSADDGTLSEYIWNDRFGATGGGISDYFVKGSNYESAYGYQSNVPIPVSLRDSHMGRGVPDVAANASPYSGYLIYLDGNPNQLASGTSAASPLFAGLIAVVNAKLNRWVGFINPTIYAQRATICRQVLGSPGPADNSYNGAPGYPAGSIWNACTGLGVIDGQALLAALQ